jgi:regulator of sigma E protease
VLFTCNGLPHWYGVGQPLKDYDAVGKLQPGDRILELNHAAVFYGEGKTLAELVNEGRGTPLALTIERGGQRSEVTITPRLVDPSDEENAATASEGAKSARPAGSPAKDAKDAKPVERVWRMGVKLENQNIDVSLFEAAKMSLEYPVAETKRIGAMLYAIAFLKEKADVGGPVRMVEEFHNAFSRSVVQGVGLIMALSVYLGLFNLLPIPALDGGRLVFLGYELITRRRANPKIEAMVHMAGIMALGLLMVFVLIKDVGRLF